MLDRAELSAILPDGKGVLPKEYAIKVEGFLIECLQYYSEFHCKLQLVIFDEAQTEKLDHSFHTEFAKMKA